MLTTTKHAINSNIKSHSENQPSTIIFIGKKNTHFKLASRDFKIKIKIEALRFSKLKRVN